MVKEKKLWELPEWKATRKRLLKKYCEQCGNTDKIMVLTHTRQFPKARAVARSIRNELLNKYISDGTIPQFEIDRDRFRSNQCTECNSRSIRERKIKRPRYSCNSCKFEFDTPNLAFDEFDPEYLKLLNNYYNDKLHKFRAEMDMAYNNRMDELKQWYLSGEDTVTYCNSCSYNFKQGRTLCQNCKKHYHTKNYDKCFYCNSRPCENCGKRVLNSMNSCYECDKDERICVSCESNKITSELNICDECVLQGKWVDSS